MHDREENIKKINDQIINAVSNINSENDKDNKSRLQKEHELITNTLKRDNVEYNKRIKEQGEYYENELLKLKEKQSEIEKENLELKQQLDQKEQEHQININLMSQQSEKISHLLKYNEEERKRLEILFKNDYDNQLYTLKSELQKQQTEFENYRNQNNKDAESNIESIKQLHQHEIHLLTTKINGLNSERNVILKSNEQNLVLYEELKRRQKEEKENLLKEIEKLRKDLSITESSKNELEANIKYYQTIKDQHDSILKSKDEFHEEDKKKLKQQISELLFQIKKMEQRDKQQLLTIKEKDKQQDDLKTETKKQLFNEKKKVEQLVEAANKIKEDYQKRNAFVIQEILNKEKTIKKLNYQLSRQRKQLSTSKLNNTNLTGLDNGLESVRSQINLQMPFPSNGNLENNLYSGELFSYEIGQDITPTQPTYSFSAKKNQSNSSQQLLQHNKQFSNVQMSLDLSNNLGNPFSPKNFPFINIVSPISQNMNSANIKSMNYNQFLQNQNLNEVLNPSPEQHLNYIESVQQELEDNQQQQQVQTSRLESENQKDDQLLSVRVQNKQQDVNISQRYCCNSKSLNKKNMKVNRSQTIFLQNSKDYTPINCQNLQDLNDNVTSSFDALNFNVLSNQQNSEGQQSQQQQQNLANISLNKLQCNSLNKLRGLVKIQSASTNTLGKQINSSIENSSQRKEDQQIPQAETENCNALAPISINVLHNNSNQKQRQDNKNALQSQDQQQQQLKYKPPSSQGKYQQNQKLIKNCEITLNCQQQPEIQIQSARNSSLPKCKSNYIFDLKAKAGEDQNQKNCQQDENKNMINYKFQIKEKSLHFKKKQI